MEEHPKRVRIQEVNESDLIGQVWTENDGGYTVVIIWHQALDEGWPGPRDLIYYVYDQDGNESNVLEREWEEFQQAFAPVTETYLTARESRILYGWTDGRDKVKPGDVEILAAVYLRELELGRQCTSAELDALTREGGNKNG